MADEVIVRGLAPGDADRLVRMFARLSPQTVYRRFFTVMPRLDGRVLASLVGVDGESVDALVLAVGEEIVGIASYHRSASDPALADVAVVVEDGWQHHGLGTQLMSRLAALAATRGITSFHADVLADNRPAVRMITHMNRHARARFDGGTLEYDLPLLPAA